ncbi:nucleobase:cation symporter-2 family protein [Weissella kandleri]|uniref:nucleobase:cation symporter-2 family protein n=1 Tax=Weissella kandleri TaxID=1616 RepID=UPI00387EBFDB
MKPESEPVNFFQTTILGLQHVLAMYAGGVLVPLLIGAALHFTPQQMTYLISVDIFMTGIGTLLQLKTTRLTGVAMPVVLGSAIQSVTPLINIGGTLGVGAMYGATIVAGIFVFLIAGLFARLKDYFPPVVTGALITVIGLSLIPVAVAKIGGDSAVTASNFGNLTALSIAGVTILTIMILNIWARGFIKSIALLLGIIVGTGYAACLGQVSIDAVLTASWFHLPRPFFMGMPTFHLASSITMMIIALTSMIESTGVYFAVAELTGTDLTEKRLANGYRSEGLAVILSGIFNTFPYSTFSQNVGVVQLSGVRSKKPIYAAAGLLILIGMLPKFGALATIIPAPALGGAMLILFGNIGVQGMMIMHTVDFTQERNLMIAAVTIGAGLGVAIYPQIFQHLPILVKIVVQNAVVVTAVLAVSLNALLPGRSDTKAQPH